jgi:GTPase Era involved in 16S rRNA processing
MQEHRSAPTHYTASAKQNPGRQAWLVEFRHPLRADANNKPGRKTRKGLGTADADRARLLVAQLNELLANDALWSLGARGEAERLYEAEVVEIFYGELEPRTPDSRPLRDKLLPLPKPDEGYAKVLLVGVPGAGKTTLVRQLIGTHPRREAFPSTAMNRTTTFPTELILRSGLYEAVVTFMSEHETRFEVEECVSAAIVDAVEGDLSTVARTFLEKSDMRFRLKYILGDLDEESTSVDPYADEAEAEGAPEGDEAAQVPEGDRQRNAAKVQEYIERIRSIASTCKSVIEAEHGPLDQMPPADRTAALDLIEEQADASREFLELISDILDELRTKFEGATGPGTYDKTTTGWPRAWTAKSPPEKRSGFIASLRPFSGINERWWGRLLTPLVNGMRVQGPFRAEWATEEPRLVLVDTEGLGHKANSTADLPEQTAALLHESDVILLIDSAKNGLTNYAAGKALESIANSGLTRKLAMVFTHMDMASQSGLKGRRLHDQVFSGVRNVVENQLSKSLTAESARFLLEQLQHHTYYVGRINTADAKGAQPELNRILAHLMAEQPAVIKPVSVPQYNPAFLMMVIQEAARDFRGQWHGLLGIAHNSEHKPKSWQSIKALSRRYAENWGETFELRPTANLRTALENALSRYLERPIGWTGDPTPEQKRDAIEQLKTAVTQQLPELVRRRLREEPQMLWQQAWAPRGTDSTITRRILIEGIYERWVPIPESRGDQAVLDFIEEMERLVRTALDEFEGRVRVAA